MSIEEKSFLDKLGLVLITILLVIVGIILSGALSLLAKWVVNWILHCWWIAKYLPIIVMVLTFLNCMRGMFYAVEELWD